MQHLLRFRGLVLSVPILMGFSLALMTAGCGGGGNTVEPSAGPTAEETAAQQNYEDIIKTQKKKGGNIVK